MKVTLKIDPETLFLIHRIVLDKSQIIPKNTTGKVSKSMRIELFEKLSKSCISYTGNANGKVRSIELRYHLAQQLWEDIINMLSYSEIRVYETNKLELLKNELHQKLL